MVENRKAGMANNALPIQMAMMIPATTYFDVRIFKGQTMALYLETKQKRVTWVHKIRPFGLALYRFLAYLSNDMAVRLSTDVDTDTIAMKLLMVQ